jgi:hypothetical protein
MTVSDTPPALTNEELEAIRELWGDIRAERLVTASFGADMVPVDIDLFDLKLSTVLAAAARTVRAETERDALAARLQQLEHGIQGMCPSCHHNSLSINAKGWLVCHWSTCETPGAAALAIADASDRAIGETGGTDAD